MSGPLSQLSDDSTSTQSLSSLLQLTDDFSRTILVLMNETTPTPVHVARANAHLDVFENVPVERRRIGKEIDSLRVLREMLNNAPTDRGKRYVACAVICCNYREKEWVMLASDWVHFLLWPCAPRGFSYFLASHFLAVKSAYKRRTPSVAHNSSIASPETEASTPTVKEPLFLDLVRFWFELELVFLHLKQLKERQASQCAVIEHPPGFSITTIGAHIIQRSIAKPNNSNAGSVSTHSPILFCMQNLS